jgi:hypothetical protein
MTKECELESLIKEFLEIIETVEETDEGREFHPTTISSCRCMDAERLGQIITKMKEAIK